MRLAFVLHQYLPRYQSGTELYGSHLATALRERGHDVRLFAFEPYFAGLPPQEQRQESVGGVPVTRIRHAHDVVPEPLRAGVQNGLMDLRFGQWLDAVRPDLVHVFHLQHLGAGLLDECAGRGIPVVVHLMDFWFLCPRVTLLHRDGSLCGGPPPDGLGCVDCVDPGLTAALGADLIAQARGLDHGTWEQDFLRLPGPAGRVDALLRRPRYLQQRLLRAQAIVAPSRFLADVFVRNGCPADRIQVLPYGLPPLAAAARRRPDGTLRLGFLGTLAEHKGAHVAVAAMQALGPGFALQLHGRPTDFPDYTARLRSLAGQDPRIRFAGQCTRDQLPAVLADLDLLLVPSLWHENTPFVVLEAIAAGVPVFGSDVGGIAELVRDGHDGELFARGSADDLARRLLRLQQEPQRLEGYRRNLPPTRSLAQNVDELEAVYHRLVRQEPSHA